MLMGRTFSDEAVDRHFESHGPNLDSANAGRLSASVSVHRELSPPFATVLVQNPLRMAADLAICLQIQLVSSPKKSPENVGFKVAPS